MSGSTADTARPRCAVPCCVVVQSTLIHLLLRFYDVQSGVIRYDGVPIDEWNLKQLRQGMAIVAQDTQLVPHNPSRSLPCRCSFSADRRAL